MPAVLWDEGCEQTPARLQGTGMEDNLSAESNAVGLAWLCETQIKPILPSWQVVRRETTKSVKRGKFNAD